MCRMVFKVTNINAVSKDAIFRFKTNLKPVMIFRDPHYDSHYFKMIDYAKSNVLKWNYR
jgi:hypothetical protein